MARKYNVVGTLHVPTSRTGKPYRAHTCRHTECADYITACEQLSILLAAFFLAAFLLLGATALAGEAASPSPQRAPREIYVPFSDLHVLLEQQPKRVLLGREEYNDLVKKAKKAPETHAPRPAAIIAADYAVTAGQQRAELKGTLSIDVLEDGLHALPLDLNGVGLQIAKLDGRNAAIGRGDAGQLLLFVEGLGRHELILEMVAPLETTAARQVLNFRLPRPAAVKLRLTAPGDVEVKGGADVIGRAVDEAARVTRFELLPREGDTSLLMTLNSHLQRQQQAVVARSVLVDEVTEAYEKLHATISLSVLYRAVDHFRFVVPEGFEITEVSSPLLARWDVQPDGPRKLLNVRLREQTTDTVVLNLSAIKTPSRLEGWRAPRLEPLDVVGQVAVVGLLVEDRLQAESLAAEGLIPIDAAVLSQALPQSVLGAAPGTPPLRAVAAWYAPQGEFSLTARYKKPPAEMAVTTSLLLIVADKGHEVLGGLSLLPQVEKRFAFDLTVPAGWQVTSVTAAGEQPLPFERYATADAAGRVRVAVPAGMPVGEEFKVNFRALRIPTGWLAEWPSAAVEFPRFAVEGATRDEGAIAVDVRDDITVRPEKLQQLTPLDAAEKPKYGLKDVPTTLAYRYENPKYAASLVVQRTKPRLTARTFSFLRIDPDGLNCHYELVYTVEEARTQRLALSLPKDTPASVAIAGLDGVKVKESVDEIAGGKRRWNVLLVEPQRGKVRLAVDFQQPLPSQEPKGLALPIAAAEGVEYQSGLLAVEGCAELEVVVNTPARRVDVGELADADYQPGRRLLGAYGFVGDPAAVKIDVLRHPGYPIYPAIVEQCELDTNLSPQGVSQTQARFKLRTKALYLQVKLPAGGELWSALLNGVPLKPQREGDSLLIGLPAAAGNAAQSLQLTYYAPVQAVALRGTVEVPAPKLLLRADRDTAAVEVPLADLVWRLYLPSGYEVVRAGGTVVTDEIQRPLPAAVQVAGLLYYLTGGLSGPPLLMPLREAARRSAQSSADRRYAPPTAEPGSAGETPEDPTELSTATLKSAGGTRHSERSVASTLNWLARHQSPDGSWSLDGFTARCKDSTCTGAAVPENTIAATALGLLPCLAMGQTHQSHGPYQQNVRSGLDYLMGQQRVGGSFASGGMVGHGLAAIALCECYGMTGDKTVGKAAQSALDYIAAAQDPIGGVWGHQPRQPGDLAVTGWQIMALKSGQMASLQVNPAVLEKAKRLLDSFAFSNQSGLVESNPFMDVTEGSNQQVNRRLTASTLLCLQYLGTARTDPKMVEGTAFLMRPENQPDAAPSDAGYRYFATQVMHNQPGADWDAWNRKMRRVLIDSQRKEGCALGSWEPDGDYLGDTRGGRVLQTGLSALTLETYYRYLPLYKIDKESAGEKAAEGTGVEAIDKLRKLEARRKEKYSSMDLAKDGAASKKIAEALKSPTQLEFVETPLSDVVDYLKEYHGIEIQLDKKALSDVGIGTDTPVTKNLKGTSLRSALRLMLRELNLTYVVQDEVLLFTTPEEAESRLETKTYPVADLVLPVGASKEDQADFDSLIDLLTSTAKPTAWDAVGGPGSIAPFESGLSIVVSQTQEVHEEIADVLEQMRKAMRETGGKGPTTLKPRPPKEGEEAGAAGNKAHGRGSRVGGMGGGMGGMGGMGGFAAGGVKKQSGAPKSPPKPSEKPVPEATPKSPATPGEKPAADDPFAEAPAEKADQSRLDELNRIYTEKKSAVEAKRGELKRLAEQLGTSNTESLAGTSSTTVDVEMLRNEEKQLEESLNATAKEIQQSQQRLQEIRQKGVVDSLVEVERDHVLLPDEPPITYPDADAWRKSTDRRKEKYSSMDLAKRGAGDKTGGEELPSPDYAKDDVGYSHGRPFVGNAIRSDQGLAGVSSLKIDLVQAPSGTDRPVTFRSLGVDPQLVVTLSNRTRFNALAWGLALAVALIGAAITRRSVRKKAKFIVAVMLLATIVPLLSDGVELAHLCNMLFFAAALLVPYYLAAGAVRWFCGCACKACRSCAVKFGNRSVTPATTALVMLAVVLGSSSIAKPQAPAPAPPGPSAPYVVQVVEPGPPVSVPDDAIILPYDPDAKTGVKEADKLLVPYEKYVELWNRAYPDKKIETRPAPAPYSLAGAAYKTLLDGDEYLLLTGQLEIDVFVEGFVQIPLGLGGGVLAQAELDGKPARLSVAEAAAKPQAAQQQEKPLAVSQPADRSLIVLHVSGKGRHKLELSVRLKLSRQGGWRVADGALPSAPATALAILVPKPQTELRLGQIADRRSYETEKADEAIKTALGVDGAVSIQWRPKVAEGQVDRSLTASSNAVLDVQEDGLRLVWQLALEFRRSQREQFSVAVPKEFLVEKVEGNNVRGWELRKTDQGQSVVVTLLKAAKDREDFTLRLWRGGAVGQGELAEFNLPLVNVTDAALHSGQLTIRRSPLLELRTLDRSGLSRTDLPADVGTKAGSVNSDESPLGIRPFEAYRFATTPFAMRLAAAPVAAQVSANVQTVLKIAEYERSLESRVCFEVQGRPVFQLQMLLPDGLRLDRVSAPGEFQYAVTRPSGRPLLTIYLASGQQGSVHVLLLGRLGGEGALKELALPRLEVLGVQRQQGDVAVQVDPAFDVDADQLKNCDKVLLSKLFSWLNPQQQHVARLGLSYRQGDYAGTLRFTLRKPDVVCDTISNVRVTDRAIEETILLDFTIRNAGIRELSFLLPEGMAGSRISVPMLRQKTIEPVSKQAGAPLRVRIELQDEVMDQLRVLVENDRLLTPGGHEAPIPTVENRPEKGDSPRPEKGTVPFFRTNRRYVAIENAGRDEVVVDESKWMEKLGRSQKEWGMLKGILGREMTQAYLVAPDARQPRLVFHTEARAAVQTVGARIGLVETTLVLDANGAYRAQQVYHLDNTTEQFLEIQLPPNAELWTARVAGEPVKPTKVPGAADLRSVRVPLIKTASGELDYEVVLKYGGRMPALGSLGNVEFPLVHCVNIKPELSQVRLYVPEEYRWFDFGGTMRQVGGDADLLAGFIGYQTKQTERIVQALRQGDKFAKVRAASNLKMMVTPRVIVQEEESDNLRSELTLNADTLQQAQKEVEELEKAPQQADAQDNNRYRLNDIYQEQKNVRARNVVQDAGGNWDDNAEQKPADQSGKQQAFNNEWLGKNKLNVQVEPGKPGQAGGFDFAGSTTTTTDASRDGLQSGATAPSSLWGKAKDGKTRTSSGRTVAPNQPSANPVVQGKAKAELSDSSRQQAGFEQGHGGRNEVDNAVDRYRQRLQQQAGQQQANPQMHSSGFINGPTQVPQFGGFDAAQQPMPARPTEPVPGTQVQRYGLGVGVNSDAGLPVPMGHEPAYTVAKPAHETLARHPAPSNQPRMPPPDGGKVLLGGITAPDISNADLDIPFSQASRPPAATGLASLDFELPTRGALYRFTTPRGEVEVTARTVSKSLLQRLIEIAVVLAVVLVAWYASRLIGAGTFGWFAGRTGSTLLICLGVLSFCGGVLPVLGLAALVTGCGLKVHRRMGLPAKSAWKNG